VNVIPGSSVSLTIIEGFIKMSDFFEEIANQYSTSSTSKNSAEVATVVIEQTATTRRVLKATIVNNSKNSAACLEIELIHERAAKGNFDPLDMPKLSNLKAGQWMSCSLKSEATLKLYKELNRLYSLAEQEGVQYGERKYVIIALQNGRFSSEDLGLVELLRQCQNSPGLAKKLAEINPELIDNAHSFRALQKRQEGLTKFETMLRESCSEQEWQDFFDEHDWVLGGALDVQVLSKTRQQPYLGGCDVSGRGSKRSDFLLSTQGAVKFFALAEIKRPDTELLNSRPYRGDDVYSIGSELNGGMAQLRSYLQTWETDGSRTEKNRDRFEGQGIYTVQPRGILVIGHLNQLNDCREKKTAFELFRQNQKDIHIVTFDEVYERAVYIVGAS
jgi:hypothetical protein